MYHPAGCESDKVEWYLGLSDRSQASRGRGLPGIRSKTDPSRRDGMIVAAVDSSSRF